jgi:hypothetical protein
MKCAGVMIVSMHRLSFPKYQEAICKLPTEVSRRVVLLTREDLGRMNPKFYGQMSSLPGPSLEKFRLQSHGVGKYFEISEIRSMNYDDHLRPEAPDSGSQCGSTALRVKEVL